MGQEFIINSKILEDKINQLLPSQGGAGAGVDLSASTTVIPIIDLTESAEGSNLRIDLQSSFSFGTITEYTVSNAATTVINTTGYWRLHGVLSMSMASGGTTFPQIQINDGTTSKICWGSQGGYGSTAGTVVNTVPYDFIIKLEASHSLIFNSPDTNSRFFGSARQLADLSGNLVNP